MTNGSKTLGTALAAAVLGLALPASALAQSSDTTMTSATEDGTTATYAQGDAYSTDNASEVSAALAGISAQTDALTRAGSFSTADVSVLSLGDLGLDASARYNLMQNMDPSAEANLQNALGGVNVTDDSSGVTTSLSDYVAALGYDPSAVLAVAVNGDDDVTVYTQ